MDCDKLSLQNICLSIGGKSILRGINITIPENKITLIYGKSGSGKTSLLNIMNFLYRPDSGEMRYNNQAVNFDNNEFIDRLRNEEIGYFHQELAFIENITLLENLKIFADIKNQKIDDRQLDFCLKLLDIEPLLNADISVMSGGERQRAAFVKLMLFPYALILMDEPTNNLDDDNIRYMMEAVKLLRQKPTTIVIVSHSKKIMETADTVYNMEEINA
ncbi:MAG: ATP-binding cassette domain-containing protein [Clostridiales bacterium]|nr:ATP-binding cassette domain-containing protein [Clostridiales bacterium]